MECTNTTERSLEAAFQASIVQSLKLKVRNGLNGDIIEENSTHSSNLHVPSASTADDVAHLYSQLSFSKVARLFPCGHRLHCFQFHPISEKNLAAAGSRYGTLALWDMVRRNYNYTAVACKKRDSWTQPYKAAVGVNEKVCVPNL